MDLHEYQAKALFNSHGLPVLEHHVAHTAAAAKEAAEKLSTETVVVKAQILAEGRAHAGGVKLVDTPREAEDYAKAILGTHLVTSHTDEKGQRVDAVIVEETCDIDKELSLSMSVDEQRGLGRLSVSAESDSNIQSSAKSDADDLFELSLDLSNGLRTEHCQQLADALRLHADLMPQFSELLDNLHQLMMAKDLLSVDIDPLVVTRSSRLICLGAKVLANDAKVHQHSVLQAWQNEPTNLR